MGKGEDRLAFGAIVAAPLKHAASLEEIAAAEGITIGAVNVLLGRALKRFGVRVSFARAASLQKALDANRKGIVE